MLNYSGYDAVGLSELIRKGEISAVEATEAAISNIQRINPVLNAVIFKEYEKAVKTARMLDKWDSRLEKSSLYGVPFLIKNLVADCKGIPFSDGSRAVHGFESSVDAELIRRQKEAGLIVLGRSNASEFGVMPTTEPDMYGPTLNPWNTEYTAGGSSGGSAAAVASGMVPVAHGNDGGGSLRIPASCCGIFTLKPSRARNPLGPVFGDLSGGIVCEHCLSRSVRDSAAMLDITSGPEPGDPYCAPEFSGSYLQETGKDPGKLKIGILSEVPEGWGNDAGLHRDCLEAVNDAAGLCMELGHTVEEIRSAELSWPDLPKTFIDVFSCFVGHEIEYWQRQLNRKISENELEPATWNLYRAGKAISGADYLSAWENLQLFTRKTARWYIDGEWDLILSPVMCVPPLKTGSFKPDPDAPDKWLENAQAFVGLTRVQNITGQPAVSVPLFWNNDGLPIGVQFAGRFGSEAGLFRLSAQLEKARPWFKRTPSVFAEEQ